jgi:uncharacterized lipoprotein YbaY
MTMKKLVILAAGALAIAGCQKGVAPAPANDNAANITALDEANLSGDANITELPADDGDAPGEAETNAK